MSMKENLLDDYSSEKLAPRRRALLPVWIKVFVWFFLITGVLSVPLLFFAVNGSQFEMALYGLETNDSRSTLGFILLFLFLFKGVVSYMLWFEKKWAIDFGIIDAVIGIIICLDSMLNFPIVLSDQRALSFRWELVILVLYLVKLIRIKTGWEMTENRSLR